MSVAESFNVSDYQRVKHLAELDLDYQELQAEFEDLTRLATSIAGTETSFVNLIGAHYQWTVSGDDKVKSVLREETVCTYAIQESEFLKIPRLDQDPRFSDKDFVKGENGLKFYLGIPLRMNNEAAVGALCVISKNETELSSIQIDQLRIIAGEIVKRLELKLLLKRSEKKVEKAVKIKERLAHDIRGPIGGIVQLLEIAQEVIDSKDEVLEILTMARSSGKDLLILAEDILNETIEDHKQKEKNFTLGSFKEKLLSLYKPQAQSKGVQFSVNFTGEQADMFSKKGLLPISGNLISNAIKFTPPEGSVSVCLKIEKKNDKKELIIIVSDTGLGMSKEQLDQLTIGEFALNEVVSKKGTEGEKGFGLGLRLVMDLVNEMNGTLEASSTLGTGTTITARLPL
ncbi:GAF domain-containing sensor histidine kinase [Nonlabens marinus]|uniref:histidine kinase n=1 Tax=Nonlabens marinus S1-08 TaxID=1454201 RepID=W8VZR1_9FLAO|nr:GAF domain-containing sensor histidine kinase [Nonlabens marinus]BAO55016.1 sensor histidine kinase [Nonlabens marinus S1-08]